MSHTLAVMVFRGAQIDEPRQRTCPAMYLQVSLAPVLKRGILQVMLLGIHPLAESATLPRPDKTKHLLHFRHRTLSCYDDAKLSRCLPHL